jgi:hypothetical protein
MSLPAYTDKQLRTPVQNNHNTGPSTPDHLNAQLHRELTQRENIKEESDYDDHYDQEEDYEPHEEFAPNAGADEARPKPIVKRKRQNPRPPQGIFGFLLISLLTAFFIWWRREKIAVGYCGVGGYGMGKDTLYLFRQS